MSLRRIVSAVVGISQGVIGGVAIAFAYFFQYNFFDIQSVVNLPRENVPLYMFLFLILGLFSTVSGVSLVYEWFESR